MIRNADEFRDRLTRAFGDYDRIRDAHMRRQVAINASETDHLGEPLEAHLRVWLVNHILSALNWRMAIEPGQQPPNTFPEFRLDRETLNGHCYLDYAGFEEQAHDGPLLLVETKRPSMLLPVRQRGNRRCTPAADQAHTIATWINNPDRRLPSEWKAALEQIQDYVRILHDNDKSVPKRVLLTNGEWFVVFKSPERTFLQSGTASAADVLVVCSPAEILADGAHKELWTQLARHQLSREVEPFPLEHLGQFVSLDAITRVMHGVGVRFHRSYDKKHYGFCPILDAWPLLFAVIRDEGVVVIDSQASQPSLPDSDEELVKYLAAVDDAARDLKARLDRLAKRTIPIQPLGEHYTGKSFDCHLGVVRVGGEATRHDDYRVITGEHTHFLLTRPTEADCRYHKHGASVEDNVACHDGDLFRKSVTPPRFFTSGSEHCCTHVRVSSIKARELGPRAAADDGRRSRPDGGAFCEIFPFETSLCCRACAFQSACAQSKHFDLPCRAQATE